LVATGSVWKYQDTGQDLGTAWIAPNYNDSAWPQGRAKLGYGVGDEATVVGYGPDATVKYITTYFRGSFTLSDPSSIRALSLRLRRDDGAVLYLNGAELYRDNMPSGPINFLTPALTSVTGADEFAFFPSPLLETTNLVAGDNVLAAEIHQRSGASPDIA